jgi:hypothetical protein
VSAQRIELARSPDRDRERRRIPTGEVELGSDFGDEPTVADIRIPQDDLPLVDGGFNRG